MNDLFSDKDFDGLQYNITLIPSNRRILVAFPKLNQLPAFKHKFKHLDKEKLIRYVILMYDRETPFRKKYSKINVRKVEVAKYVGFKMTEGVFEDNVMAFLRGNIKEVNRMIVDYVRHQKNYKYTYLVGLEEGFYTILNEVTKGQIKNLPQLKNMQDQLEETMAELLNDDKNHLLRDELLRYMEDERLMLRPEDIARKLHAGESPITLEEIS